MEENRGHLISGPDFAIAGNQTLKVGTNSKSSFYQIDKQKISKLKTDSKPRVGRMSKDNSLSAIKGAPKRMNEKS